MLSSIPIALVLVVLSPLQVGTSVPDVDAGTPDAASTTPAESAAPTPPDAASSDDVTSTGTGATDATAAPAATFVGTVVDGATILGVTSEKRLPDGRVTSEPCGFEHDVVVEYPITRAPGEAGPSRAVERAVLRVPCVKGERGLVAGAPLLVLVDKAPVELPKTETPPESEPVADDASAPFVPVQAASIDKKARLKEGFHRAQGPLIAGGTRLYGVVALDVDVRKDGTVADARVVRSANPRLDEETITAVKRFLFHPALAAAASGDGKAPAGNPTAVDSTLPVDIEWTKDPVPGELRRDYTEDDVVLVDTAFLKGELSNLGRVQLVNPANSLGVGLGFAAINNQIYLHVRPNADLHYGKFSLGLGTPLRFQLFDLNGVQPLQPETYELATKDAGRFRTEDWDRLFVLPYSDWIRPLRYASYGKKEDQFFFEVQRVNPITIGHGQLMRRYAPNVDIDESNLFAELDAYADFGGVELIAGPLPIPRIVGGLVFVKPLGLFMDDTLSKSLSFGASYVTDLNAPTTLYRSIDPVLGRPQLAVDLQRFVYPERDSIIGRQVQGAGIDAEVKALKWEFIDLKVYADYSHLVFPDIPEANIDAFNGGGATVGALLRLSFGSTPVRAFSEESEDVRFGRLPREMKAAHAARFRGEARAFSPQYLPSYWNPLYEIDRFQLSNGLVDENQRASLPTKVEFLASQANEPWRAGYYLEASYSWVDVLAVTAVYEDAWKLGGDFLDVPAAKNFILHAETAALDLWELFWLQAFATYHYRNFGLQDWVRLGQFTTDNEVLYVGGRLQILILAFNLGVQRAYRINFLEEDLGSLRPVRQNGPPLRHTSVGQQSQYNFNFDVEIGWSW
jgi:TonB family protein